MGNYLVSLKNKASQRNRGIKRSFEDDDLDSTEVDYQKQLSTPQRKKLMSTSQYIYKTLFLEGQSSDVTIVALNTDWKLHKVYLCQAPYFSSMFNGSWKEVNDNIIHIEIVDPNVTIEALKIVLGSLYQDEITIKPTEVVSILGAAIAFQLDSLIQQCSDILLDTINVQTVIGYIDATNQYGLKERYNDCFNWLLRNLLSHIPEHPKILREISLALMCKLISSPDLFVIQTEFSIYIVLKMWVFLNENKDWDGKNSDCIAASHKYFQQLTDSPFLNTTKGENYKEVYKCLRLEHLVHHYADVEMIEIDRIIPTEWLHPVYKNQWYSMLRIDQAIDKGPIEISEEEFNSTCFRCGRILPADRKHMWRWMGYNFGLDLVLTYERRVLSFKRNDRLNTTDYQGVTNHLLKRNIIYRFTIASINDQKQVINTVSTGLKSVTFNKTEEIEIMKMDEEVKFPLILSANFILTSKLPVTQNAENITRRKLKTFYHYNKKIHFKWRVMAQF